MAFVVREGSVNNALLPHGSPSLSLNMADLQTLDRQSFGWIYVHQPNIHTVVSFLARNIAQLKLKTYQRVSDTDRKELSDHPMAQLIQNPNPYTTGYRLMYGIVADRAIYDMAVLLKIRTADGGMGLVRLPPEKVTVGGENWLAPTKFILHGQDKDMEFDADEVIYFRGYHPHTNRVGTSPIESLRDYLIEEYNANVWRGQMWKNSARVSGYLERPADAPRWQNADRERFGRAWRSQYTGAGPQAGGTPILEDGMKFVPASIKPNEAQYIESRKLTREECANAYHIPPPMVGILEHATFSNIEQQHKMLYQDTLGPWLSDIEQEFRLQLLPDFESGTRARKIYQEFNIQEKLDGSFTEQSESLSTAVGSPWMTPNEGRARMNLPALDGGDDLVVPLNVTKGGQASPQDGGDVPPAVEEPKNRSVFVKARASEDDEDVRAFEKELTAFFLRQKQVVLSNYGAKAGDTQFDADRWNRELARLLAALGLAVSQKVGLRVVKSLNLAGYDAGRTEEWMTAHASGVASGVNATTAAAVASVIASSEDAKADLTALFDNYAENRAPAIAKTEVSAMSGFGSVEAVEQNGRAEIAKKKWVTGTNPRETHKALDGQTVGVNELFSNGARWPGDSRLPDEERSNCNCEIDIILPGEDSE